MTSTAVRPNSRPGTAHLAAQRPRHRLEAVADPEHRYAGLERPRRRRWGAPSAYTDCGPPHRMIALGRGPGSRPRSSCAARSRSRPWPRAPGGRSAGRTAPRSRRRGRGHGRRSRRPLRIGSAGDARQAASLSGVVTPPAPASRSLRAGPAASSVSLRHTTVALSSSSLRGTGAPDSADLAQRNHPYALTPDQPHRPGFVRPPSQQPPRSLGRNGVEPAGRLDPSH